MVRQPEHVSDSRSVRRAVEWKDLVRLSRWERVWECSISLPWLIAALWAYSRIDASTGGEQYGWFVIGAGCSFFFFLTGLRQSHNAQHSCLGIGQAGHTLMLFMLSALMLASMHAVKVTHLHHHRHCLDEHDEEARHAHWPWYKVLVMGPVLFVRLHASAIRLSSAAQFRRIIAELVMIAVLLSVVVAAGDCAGCLRWHMAAMLTGECLTAFFAVWIVHRGCEAHGQIARTQRGWVKNLVSYSMFYHLEHHLWPSVPTCHLPKLASRLDRVAPGYRDMQVI